MQYDTYERTYVRTYVPDLPALAVTMPVLTEEGTTVEPLWLNMAHPLYRQMYVSLRHVRSRFAEMYSYAKRSTSLFRRAHFQPLSTYGRRYKLS